MWAVIFQVVVDDVVAAAVVVVEEVVVGNYRMDTADLEAGSMHLDDESS